MSEQENQPNPPKDQESKVEYNPDTHYIEKKMTYYNYVLFEFLVFFCISATVFFGTYLGTEHFVNEKLFNNNITVYTEFFSLENIKNTICGIVFVIGGLSVLNSMITDSELNIKTLIKRLIASGIDFVYLMISTMLGFSLATYMFTLNQPMTKDVQDLQQVIFKLILLLLSLAIIYIPTFMVFPHKDKISDFKKKK